MASVNILPENQATKAGHASVMGQRDTLKRATFRAGAIALAVGVVFVSAIQAREAPHAISSLIDSVPRGLMSSEPVAVSFGTQHRQQRVRELLNTIPRMLLAQSSTGTANDADTGSVHSTIMSLDQSNVVGLAELLRTMMANQPRYQAVVASVNAARESYKGAWAAWMPTVDLTMNGGNERIQNPDADDTDLEFYEGDVSLTQLMYDFGGTNATIKNSRLSLSNADIQANMTRQGLIQEGLTTLLNLYRAKRSAEFAKASETQFERLVAFQQAKVDSGGGVVSNVAQAQAQLARAQARTVQMQGQVAQMEALFINLFGSEAGDDVPVPRLSIEDRLPTTLEDNIQQVLDGNFGLRLANASVMAAKITETEKRAALYPKIQFKADFKYKHDVGGVSDKKEERLVKFELTYPLFDGFKNLTAYRSSRYGTIGAQKGLIDTKRGIEQQARGVWAQYQMQKANVEAIRAQAQRTAEFLELARKELKLGKRPLLELLAAEVQHIEALNGTLSAMVDFALAQYNLLNLKGQLEIENIAL